MTIETKYSIGDQVYGADRFTLKIKTGKINAVFLYVDKVQYGFDGLMSNLGEEDVYPSLEECKEALIERIRNRKIEEPEIPAPSLAEQSVSNQQCCNG